MRQPRSTGLLHREMYTKDPQNKTPEFRSRILDWVREPGKILRCLEGHSEARRCITIVGEMYLGAASLEKLAHPKGPT